MQKFKNKIAFIVATKDRPRELQCMMKSIETQSYKPDQLVIVDGGEKTVRKIVEGFPSLNIKYLRCFPPSVSKQRNMGINSTDAKITLIGFCDDDVVFKARAFEEMMIFWESASKKVGLASFNLNNPPKKIASQLKSTEIADKLGLYSRKTAAVLPSGFQTIIEKVSKNTFVDYLPSTALVCRNDIVERYKLDEWFKGYDYVADLDFSYSISKQYALVIVSNAYYNHNVTSVGKESAFTFGIKEVTTRIYFVKKHQELSLTKCYLSLAIRIFLSFYMAFYEQKLSYFLRICGNLVGIAKQILVTNDG